MAEDRWITTREEFPLAVGDAVMMMPDGRVWIVADVQEKRARISRVWWRRMLSVARSQWLKVIQW